MIVQLTEQLAYQFIETNTKNPNANEWSIYKTKIDLPETQQAVSGSLRVQIPKHVLE